MKTRALLAVTAILAFGGIAFAADIASLAWNEPNIETLRSLDKSAILQFINKRGGLEGPDAIKAKEIWEFEWVDLAGDGKYELALIRSSGPCCVGLLLYWQDAPGKVRFQAFGGAGKLSKTIRDLNGDGKKELVLSKLVVENSGPLKFYWPAVYRLENGEYVEASRDFQQFYDDEVLPQLNKQISAYEAPGTHDPDRHAGLMMERGKILRVLRREPTAGLQQAYKWMTSDDPYLLQDAAVTFKEVGGHEEEARAATQAYWRAFQRRRTGAK